MRATAATLRSPAHLYAYPYEARDRLWKTVLLHQFHDILPGSSIAWVHREARETYERVQAELADLVADAVAALGAPGGWWRSTPLRTNAVRWSSWTRRRVRCCLPARRCSAWVTVARWWRPTYPDSAQGR